MQSLSKRYPLAPNPIWWALQGEAHLRGFGMTFVRLAGCSVGCAQCDTDYSVDSKATADEIAERAYQTRPAGDRDMWVWITGGEPTDHDLRPLLAALKRRGFATAVATSGTARMIPPVDWLSVSPHGHAPEQFQQRYGNELKIVDGLNGLSLDDFIQAWPDDTTDFMYRYVQPMWVGDATTGYEDSDSMNRCLKFLKEHPNWALSRQDHKHWGVL